MTVGGCASEYAGRAWIPESSPPVGSYIPIASASVTDTSTTKPSGSNTPPRYLLLVPHGGGPGGRTILDMVEGYGPLLITSDDGAAASNMTSHSLDVRLFGEGAAGGGPPHYGSKPQNR